ncbi:Chloramphenicol acetyltransferase-like domain protein [Cordyceps fumosorosea ARSEF 2679]|uniref:Chloramphenicol acetyltransferase-like domain protein n=1 Tax=Cordyceps fumosorosea (strain ARSEF 2679) TaxID=1081104 RepID=A0A167TNC0_CORFA|nr:Chloramphenicol acetyltransferase-like domain protein [Cordyceps fumosorosea ARSEF 2679]OAA60775.1 Chloramphenicol acetyltransferase-like domain protein [Cordyceps fumosorosea ARSEF 2679]
MSQEPPTMQQPRPLTTWNQAALRGYVRQVHCFETDGGPAVLDALGNKLEAALEDVCLRMPHMAGKLSLSKEKPGIILLHTSEDDRVTCRTCDVRGHENLAYSKLKEQGFPAGAFIGPVFDTNATLSEDGPPIPVTQFLLNLVDGGILMSIFVHHSVTDGVGVNQFLTAVAAAMKDSAKFRREPLCYPSKIDIPVPSGPEDNGHDAELAKALIKQCPDLTLAETATAHSSYLSSVYRVSQVKFGGIFVFGPDKMRLLKEAVVSAGYPRMPSTFACLAALSWAFMTTTRLKTVGIADESREADVRCRLYVPTWWGTRLFKEQLSGYAGNEVVFIEASSGAEDLFTISEATPANFSHAKGALMRVVQSIETTLGSVDEAYVKTRATLFNNVRDPRQVQYSFMPADPRQLFFNSWRRLGADIEWTIPTATGSKLTVADAVRKSQSAWNESAGLIMPGRQDQHDYETVLSSDVESMAALRDNAAWKSWVDREIF